MRKLLPWLGLAILIIGGVLILMIFKEDSGEGMNNNNENKSELNLDELREKLKGKGQLISKDKVNQQFDPNKKGDKTLENLSFTLKEISENGSKSFDFTVENITDDIVTLSFGTSQRYDYEIYNQENERIYHYSEGKSFLQVLEDIQLEPGENLSYEITLPSLDSGNYTLVVRLAAQDYGLLRQIATFTVK